LHHYANEAARVVQKLCKSWGIPVILLYLILFWRKVAKLLHNSCPKVLFHFILILLQMGEACPSSRSRSIKLHVKCDVGVNKSRTGSHTCAIDLVPLSLTWDDLKPS